MAIVDFAKLVAPAVAADTNTAGKPFVKAKTWLNVYVPINGYNVNLPLGLAIDTMAPLKIQGQNAEWIQKRTAQNKFLEALQELGAGLAPGETHILEGVTIEIRRVNDELVIAPETNEYAVDFKTLFAGSKKPAADEVQQAAE